MSYDLESHLIVKKIVDKHPINLEEAKALLDMVLAEEEQLSAIRTYAILNEMQDFEELLDWDCYNDDCFSQRFGVDEKTIRRWRSEGMTTFERDMVIYLLCQAEIENDRIHFCPTCGTMFSAFMPQDSSCPKCQAEQLAKKISSMIIRSKTCEMSNL